MEEERRRPSQSVLFICKKRFTSGGMTYTGGLSSGLFNSANFVVDMLLENGIDADIVDVVDGNAIDKELYNRRPDVAIFEAVWVTPEKLDELHDLHPDVKFIVRVHSETPFLAVEGQSIEWLYEYFKRDYLKVAFNSKYTTEEFEKLVKKTQKPLYLPNYYKVSKNAILPSFEGPLLKVGCFGAIRPLKNQLIQAIAAINYANKKNLKLEFHINTERIESGGSPALKNIRALFKNNPDHTLVEHEWIKHDDFLELVKTMDVGLQVSFTESFNIVTADFITCNVPIVVSDEIGFVHPIFHASTTESEDIEDKIHTALKARSISLQYINKQLLRKFSARSEEIWVSRFK